MSEKLVFATAFQRNFFNDEVWMVKFLKNKKPDLHLFFKTRFFKQTLLILLKHIVYFWKFLDIIKMKSCVACYVRRGFANALF